MDISEALFLAVDHAEPDESAAAFGALGQSLGQGIEMFDTDDDGYAETRVSHTDAGMTVARDRDHDGVMDAFTSIGRGGRYESWEISRSVDGSARWETTSSGEVFE